jgi:hypothetical protein
MRKILLTAGVVAAMTVAAAAPGVASAHHWRHYHRHSCSARRGRAGATGAVAGTVGGAVIGNAAGHGNVGGTLLGAGLGALAGHAIAKSTVHC